MIHSDRRFQGIPIVLVAIAFASSIAPAQQPAAGRATPPGTVDGLVSDTSLAPLAGATVSILGTNVRVVTGDNGRFRMSDLKPGPYILFAQRIGFEPATMRVQVAKADTSRLSIVLDRTATVLDTVRVKGR